MDSRGSKTASAALTAPVGDERPTEANSVPEFKETASVTRTVPLGTAAGRPVGAPVRATDTDQGDILTYSLSGADADAFDIDSATGQIRTKVILDRAVKETYAVTVSVHDGFDGAYIPSTASDATIDATITVTAVPVVRPPRPRPSSNRPPVFADGPRTDRPIAENTAAGENVGPPVVATDSGILTFTLGGADAGFFGIVAATGQIQVGDGTILDYEAEKNTYGVEVAATDSSGATARITVTVIVTNVDEAGTVTLPPEEPVVDTALTATLSDPDGDITGTTWQWARTMDMAAGWDDIPGATDAAYTPVATDDGYYLRVTASYTDGHGTGKSTSAATASAVTNLDEAGTVTLSMMRPVVGAELTAMLDDPDGNVSGMIWQWARSKDKATGWTDIDGATSAAYTPVEGDKDYYLEASVSYTDGHGSGKTAMAVSDYAVTARDPLVARYDANGNGTIERGEVIAAIRDYLDGEDISRSEVIRLINLYPFSGGGAPSSRPPVFVDGPRTDRSIAENTSAGENVGPPVVATDSGILTYMLGGADAGFFGIVAATGQIQVGDGTILDYEAEKNTYGVEVAATDSSGATAMITVTIAVTNVDEAGTVTLPPEEPVVDTALTATLSDPDGDITGTTWQWARTMDMAAGWDDIPGATDAAYTPVATDDGYYLRVTASYTDPLASGQTAMAVSDYAVTAENPLAARYDANGNGMIDKAEVIAAINDYLFGEGDEAISKAEIIELINAYLLG